MRACAVLLGRALLLRLLGDSLSRSVQLLGSRARACDASGLRAAQMLPAYLDAIIPYVERIGLERMAGCAHLPHRNRQLEIERGPVHLQEVEHNHAVNDEFL